MSASVLSADGAGLTMRAATLELLNVARRRIWAARTMRLLRNAALLCLAAGVAMLTAHFLLRALPGDAAAALLAVPLGAALLLAARRRPSLQESARWLDRHLGAQSVFSTYLEFGIEQRAPASARALQAFERSGAAVLAHSQDALRKQRGPSAALLLALLGSCMLLVALLLSVPGRNVAASRVVAPAAGTNAANPAALGGDSDQSDRAVRAALLQDRALTPDENRPPSAANPGAAIAAQTNSGDAAAAKPEPSAGHGVPANGTGSAAGDNAATGGANDAPPTDLKLRSRFRALSLRGARPGEAGASGTGIALDAASLSAQAADFDRRQAGLAAHTPPALLNQPAASGVVGPSGAVLQRRYLVLRGAHHD